MESRLAPASVFIIDQGPTLGPNLQRGQLRIRPLGNEIRQDLGLDHLERCVGERLSHEFHGPFGDPTRGVRVSDDLPKQEQGDYRNRVGLEVVLQLAPHEHNCVEQLLDLWV
jgi:hypothetical protein